MRLIDTHAHLYLSQFDEDRPAMIERMVAAGVSTVLLPNINLETIAPMHQLCRDYPDICFPMMGLHPCDVKENFQEILNTMEPAVTKGAYIAIGETGIDLYWDKTTLEMQIQSFERHITWAKTNDLPLVIHARESFDEIFAVLDRMNDRALKGVFHCFTGTTDQAQKILEYGGFRFGIGGVLTHEKSGLDKVLPQIPLEYLVLETDSPFLAPKPHRGKRNESAFVALVAQRMATVLDISVEDVARITTKNALTLFSKLPHRRLSNENYFRLN